MRRITSLTLLLSGLVELISSVVLYVLPAGRVAYWTDYRLLGLSKTQWTNIHLTVGTLLFVAAGLHLFYNWRPILAYLKNRSKAVSFTSPSFLAALALTLYCTFGTLTGLPPMQAIVKLGEHFTESANARYGEPPYGHAELSSLLMFSRKMDLDLDLAVGKLKSAGLRVQGAGETLLEIAERNGLTPQQVYDIIREAKAPQARGAAGFPDTPPPGFGNKTIAEICQDYGLDQSRLLAELARQGLELDAEATLKEAARASGLTPMALFEKIQAFAAQSGDR